jgi:multisubunit Na+/H+ antiporter MnhB subunit
VSGVAGGSAAPGGAAEAGGPADTESIGPAAGSRRRGHGGVLLGLGCALLGIGLGWVVWTLEPAVGLAPAVAESLPASGVRSEITAVLLNFRGYDTLLEVVVLLAAMVAIWSLERGRPAVPPPLSERAEPVLALLLRGVVPLIVLTSVYLVWRGSHAPGGAFQGGALLGGAAVLLLAAGVVRGRSPAYWPVRAAVAAGPGLFLLVAGGTLLLYGGLLFYPPGGAYWIIVGIEVVVAFSIAAVLADLFVDVPAVEEDGAGGGDE